MLQFILCATAALSLSGSPAQVTDGEVQITISQPASTRGNRAPARLPLGGYIDTLAGMAVLTFKSPCGEVDVDFQNLGTGDSLQATVDGTGTVMIPLACTPGPWTVTFTLASGAVYYGEFEL